MSQKSNSYLGDCMEVYDLLYLNPLFIKKPYLVSTSISMENIRRVIKQRSSVNHNKGMLLLFILINLS